MMSHSWLFTILRSRLLRQLAGTNRPECSSLPPVSQKVRFHGPCFCCPFWCLTLLVTQTQKLLLLLLLQRPTLHRLHPLALLIPQLPLLARTLRLRIAVLPRRHVKRRTLLMLNPLLLLRKKKVPLLLPLLRLLLLRMLPKRKILNAPLLPPARRNGSNKLLWLLMTRSPSKKFLLLQLQLVLFHPILLK